jgi:hypothetical protein
MSARDNEAIVRETHEAFNARVLDRAAAYAVEVAEWLTVATEETFRGPEGYKRYMQNWTTAFSDASTEVTAVHAGENIAIVEFIGRGTHDGPLRSPGGDIPATAAPWRHGSARCSTCGMAGSPAPAPTSIWPA